MMWGLKEKVGGEGANRTLLPMQSIGTAVLKTARATRHPSLSHNKINARSGELDREPAANHEKSFRQPASEPQRPNGLEHDIGLRELPCVEF